MRRVLARLWRDESGSEALEYALLLWLLILPQIASQRGGGIGGLYTAINSFFAGIAAGLAAPL